VLDNPAVDPCRLLAMEEVTGSVHDLDANVVGRLGRSEVRDVHADAAIGGAVQVQRLLRRHLRGGGLKVLERRVDTDPAERSPVVAEDGRQVAGSRSDVFTSATSSTAS
jgi:hypothetical protein